MFCIWKLFWILNCLKYFFKKFNIFFDNLKLRKEAYTSNMGYSLTDSSVDIVLLKNWWKTHTLAKPLHGFRQQVTWHLQVLIMQKFEAFSPIPFFLGVQDQEAYHPPPPIIRLLLRDFLMQLFKLFFKIQMKGVLSSRHVR